MKIKHNKDNPEYKERFQYFQDVREEVENWPDNKKTGIASYDPDKNTPPGVDFSKIFQVCEDLPPDMAIMTADPDWKSKYFYRDSAGKLQIKDSEELTRAIENKEIILFKGLKTDE